MIKAPSKNWLPFVPWIFGFCLVLTDSIITLAIALGKVEQATSHGLDIILGCLLALTGGFTQWAFQYRKPDVKEDGK